MTTDAKSFDFPLSVHWVGGRRTVASVGGKPNLEVATPPEFKGGVEGVWSPEDLLVGSVGACFAVTLVAVAERREVPLRGLEVDASGRVTQRKDGRIGFVEVDLEVAVDDRARLRGGGAAAAEAAERGCLVARSLDFPVRLKLDVRGRRARGSAL